MPTLTFLANQDYRTFGGITSVITHRPGTFVYTSDAGFTITIRGTGLTYGAQNHLTGGTITDFSINLGPTPVATWTGLSFAASQYVSLAFAATPDLETLSIAMLAGNDLVIAGPFNSRISGAMGNDSLVGNTGDDWLFGGSGRDTYDGGNGIDGVSFFAREPGGHGVRVDLTLASNQILDDGFGNVENALRVEKWEGTDFADAILGGGGSESMWGLSGHDSLRGGGGNDWIVGNAGNDSLYGDAGFDTLFGDSGRDIYNGALGSDFLVFQSGDAGQHGAIIDMTRGVAQVRDDGYGNIETIKFIENLVLTRLNDRAVGSTAANIIFGNFGNDTVLGMGGNDSLVGSAGSDILTGGTGGDSFIFDDSLAQAGLDHITDMVAGLDKILVNIDWDADLRLGTITAAEFRSGQGITAALTTKQRFIYDTSSGSLYLDADGVGGAAAVKFAVLDNLAALTFADIVILPDF